MFVTLPPMIQVLMLTPRFGHWFIGLTWVRFITFRRGKQQRRGSSVDGLVLSNIRLEGYDDDTKTEGLLDTNEDYKIQLTSDDS